MQQLDEQLMTAKTTRDKQLCHIGYIHLHGAPRRRTVSGLLAGCYWSGRVLHWWQCKRHMLGACRAARAALPLEHAQLRSTSQDPEKAWCAPTPWHAPNASAARASPAQWPRGAHTAGGDADKHSGMELKAPVLSNALRQPFSTTGVLSSLMAKCEAKARDLDAVTGGLDQLLDACPHYQGLFLVKCAPRSRTLGLDVPSW